ncbi:MAG: hypothetical protein ACLUDH_07340 [Faecalispora sporosphaeroides]|uniref:Uncharacterized protein n=1 Tax=Faecalispora sporosphaeroides TaxID=1549 RepID=A0A928KW10_9FIRM|nr:hypothetical protein [Faecalispora sporosphaeroides]MBE6832422.1 hypothetical protein [Faecalispora sporosphaeroides]
MADEKRMGNRLRSSTIGAQKARQEGAAKKSGAFQVRSTLSQNRRRYSRRLFFSCFFQNKRGIFAPPLLFL